MTKLGDYRVLRAHGRKVGEATPRQLTADEIADLADASGELREEGRRWDSLYGQATRWAYVTAHVEPKEESEPGFTSHCLAGVGRAGGGPKESEPGFNGNIRPVDLYGKPLEPGQYDMFDGTWQTVKIIEGDSNDLPPFRIEELSPAVQWLKRPPNQEADGVSRSAGVR